MAQSKSEIVELLSRRGLRPRHRFGQNFMIDRNLVRIVADEARIVAGELVIEIGPGTGTLTEELLARGARVLAVEIDRDLAGLLRERFASHGSFALIEGDALAGKHELNRQLAEEIRLARGRNQAVKLAANLPYNIASPLIIELLLAGVALLVFSVQKEVAQRLRAAPGTKDYGVLSIMVQLLSDVEILRTLPPQAFWPAPEIESALVRMTPGNQLGDQAGEFGRFVQALFSSRRKTIRKALTQMGMDARSALDRVKVDPRGRPEDLAPSKLLELFKALPR